MTLPPSSNSSKASGDDWPRGRVGHVALLGRPNTGKSTLLNALLDFHLAAVSPKPQTTRRQLLGIASGAGYQFLFLDTPGVHEPQDELGEAMLNAVRGALRDADVVVCITDPTREPGAEDRLVAELGARAGKPVVLLLNKRDVHKPEQRQVTEAFYRQILPSDTLSLAVTALEPRTLEPLVEAIRARLPEGPFLYPADTLTTAFERQIGAELIRETLLDVLRDEVPHATAITIESWDESREERRISATLHVERDSQKAIIIGERGLQIKEIRQIACEKLEALVDAPVFLELWVKVSKDWRRHRTSLRDFGYIGR